MATQEEENKNNRVVIASASANKEEKRSHNNNTTINLWSLYIWEWANSSTSIKSIKAAGERRKQCCG